jgi:capsid protein
MKKEEQKQRAEEVRIARLERKLLKADARHEWIKNSNMKQFVVTLTDTYIVKQD